MQSLVGYRVKFSKIKSVSIRGLVISSIFRWHFVCNLDRIRSTRPLSIVLRTVLVKIAYYALAVPDIFQTMLKIPG